MTTARINGVELYYERAGQGDRIVMTHGAWSDGRTWEAVAGRLTDRFEPRIGGATAGAMTRMVQVVADRMPETWRGSLLTSAEIPSTWSATPPGETSC